MIVALFPMLMSGRNADELLEQADSFYEKGLLEQAATFYRQAADSGSVQAQYLLGYSYYNGEGVYRSYTEAVRWFKRAVAGGHHKAEYNLAYCYMNGDGVPRDYDKAWQLLEQSARGGYDRAMITIAEFYEKGILVEQDAEQCELWKRRAKGEAEENVEIEKPGGLVINELELQNVKNDEQKPPRPIEKPVVKILYPENGATFHTNTMLVKYQLKNVEKADVEVWVDDELQPATRAVRRASSVEVDMPKHDCEITIVARNAVGESRASISLKREAEEDSRPRLLAVVVGVGEYNDEQFPNLRLAKKDATDFARAISTKRDLPYSEVEVKILLDGDAKRGDIMDGLKWLKQQGKPNDLCVFYFAGHGYRDEDDNFYFIPSGATFKNYYIEGVSSEDVLNMFKNIDSKVVVMADACYSAMLVKSPLLSKTDKLIVYASSTPDNRSIEDLSWGNGAFTRALLEAMSGKARRGNESGLTTLMLDSYLTERVKAITGDKQKTAFSKPVDIDHFDLFNYEK